ncbi:MAG: flagellar export chaperone FliS [Solirubrobacteraceae bacterium]
MTGNYAATRQAYQRSAVLTATQEQLIVMLYDGAIRFLAQASSSLAEQRIEATHNQLRRAEMIIAHLLASLDYEHGGEIAPRLASIYLFCQRHLNQARINKDPQRIDQVRDLLGTLRDAWAQVANQ